MKVHDISRELLSAPVYPTHVPPRKTILQSIEGGDSCNVCELTITSHDASHLDAPRHFIKDGRTIDEIELSRCVGSCTVWEGQGELNAEDLAPVLAGCEKRLLIKGDVIVTDRAAEAIAQSALLLIGVETLTVGPEGAPAKAHQALLSKEVLILENIDLSKVQPGKYLLCAAPLKIGGGDGAPCRALLIEE